MGRKKVLFFVGMIIFWVTMPMFLGFAKEARSKTIEIKVISFLPSSDKVNLHALFFFLKEINEKAKGELVVKYVGGPEVIPAFQQPEALRKGVIDMIINAGPYCAPLVPEGVGTQLVLIDHIEQRKSGYYELLVEAYKRMNARYLGRSTNMPNNLYTMKPVKNMADLSGRRFRSIPSYETYYKKLGIVGVTMPNSEAYTALERGVIGGLTTPPSMIMAMGWNEVLKYRVGPPFWTTDINHLVNLDKWNQLPKHLQEVMINAQIETEKDDLAFWETKVKEMYATQEKIGMKEIVFSSAETKKFIDIVYAAGWEFVEGKLGPERAAKLKAASSKK
jgi:TRAP-type C4-dicarboxylate transport system substrate-binding protein